MVTGRIKHCGNGIVHSASGTNVFNKYITECGREINFNHYNNYTVVSMYTEVTCKKCLKKIEGKKNARQ